MSSEPYSEQEEYTFDSTRKRKIDKTDSTPQNQSEPTQNDFRRSAMNPVMSNPKFTKFSAPEQQDEILKNLTSCQDDLEFDAIFQLCNILSISSAETLQGVRLNEIVPELVRLMRKEENPDLGLMSCRCLMNLLEAAPGSASLIVGVGAVPVLNAKLLSIDFIDLAEVSIQVLYLLSQQYALMLMKEGVLNSSLMFYDFFPISIQRMILKMAFSLCKRVPHDGWNNVLGICPNLEGCLSSDDSVICEFAIKTLTRVLQNAPSGEFLKTIVTKSLIEKILMLFGKKQTDPFFTSLLLLMEVICQSSVDFTIEFQRLGLADILDKMLNEKDKSLPMNDIMLMMMELIPQMNIHNQFITAMNQSRRKDLFASLTVPNPSVQQNTNNRSEIATKPSFVDFCTKILPVLLRVYSVNLNHGIRCHCLTMIGSIIYYTSGDNLTKILSDIPISSFLSKVLASSDLTFVGTGLQITEVLIGKLPQIFHIYFLREGVNTEIIKLSGLSSSKDPVMWNIMKEKQRVAYLKEEQTFQTLKADAESKGEPLPTWKAPMVEPPNIPETSKVFEREVFKSQDLAEYVVAISQMFHLKFIMDHEQKESMVCEKLRDIAHDLTDIDDLEEEEEILRNLAKIISSDDGISTYEFYRSGLIQVLLKYLQPHRFYMFQQIFDVEIANEKRELLSFGSSFGTPSRYSSPFRSKIDKKHTFLSELVRLIQNTLSTEENLPLIIADQNSLSNGLPILFGIFEKEFTIILKTNSEEKAISVSPLCTVKHLETMLSEEGYSDLSRDLTGFSLEEFNDDEFHFSRFSNTTPPQEYYTNLKLPEQACKYEFYINGFRLAPHDTMLACVYRCRDWSVENLRSRHPLNMRQLWDGKTAVECRAPGGKSKSYTPIFGLVLECCDLLKILTKISSNCGYVNEKIVAKLLRQINDPLMLLLQCIPLWCERLMLDYKFLFPFESRKYYYSVAHHGVARSIKVIHETSKDYTRFLQFFRMDKQKIEVDRRQILTTAYDVLSDVKNVLEFQYENEVGFGNGPTCEYYTLVSREFTRSSLEMWLNDEKEEFIVKSHGLFPRPNSSPASIALFYTLGKFVARGIFDNRLMDLPFSRAFCKILIDGCLEFSDLQFVDPILFKQFNGLLNAKDVDSMGLYFCLYQHPAAVLGKHSSEEPVTRQNVEEYVQLCSEYLLGSGIRKQVDSFINGFNSLLNIKYLALFTEEELDTMINGEKQTWNEKILLEGTKCDYGYSHSSTVVKNLFRILCEMDGKMQRQFLLFCTGSPKIPIGGIGNLKPKLTIVKKVVDRDQDPNTVLPSVMTCTNYLKLPEYSTLEILKSQLYTAIIEGQGSFLLS